MKENKLKKYSIRFGIVFFIMLAVLTYFSNTIDNMLLPQVKVTDVITGSLNAEEDGPETKYLLPISSVTSMGNTGTVFVIVTNENEKTFVDEVNVNIINSDDLYYEVTSDNLYSSMQVVYKTSKNIYDGARVYVEMGEE